jgi:unsaturated rhamnogalacturonyl hydrolase
MRTLGLTSATSLIVLLTAQVPAQEVTLTDGPPTWNDLGTSNAPAPTVGGLIDLDPPTPKDVKESLDRVRDLCVRSTPLKLVDARTGLAITDRSKPIATATLERGTLEFGEWSGEMALVHSGLILASEATGDASYQNHTVKSLNFLFESLAFVRQTGRDPGLRRDALHRMLAPQSLAECSMVAPLLRLHLKQNDARFLEVVKVADDFLMNTYPRLSDGTLVRAAPERQTLALDDLALSVPTLTLLARLRGEARYYDDAARQVLQMADRMFDQRTGLWDHAFFLDLRSDPRTYWGRANGWALLATVELLDDLPPDHASRERLVTLLRHSIASLQQTQSGTGLWHQLLDKNDSYLETSASALSVYVIARAINRGYVEPAYASVAFAGWKGVARRIAADGKVTGVAIDTPPGYDNPYYYNRTTDPPHPLHGYGPVLLAGAETFTLLANIESLRSGALKK